MNNTAKTIGLLALQGDFDKHRHAFEDGLNVPTRLVRTPEDLAQVEALLLPGGESTTIIKLMQRVGLDAAIKDRIADGMPAFGTCAGMILLSKRIEGRPEQPTLGVLDVTVARNAFGRQIDSFEADIPFEADIAADNRPVRGVFIRAPYATEIGAGVQVLAHFEERIVGVRQGNLLAIAFHPELTDDTRLHEYFVNMVKEEGIRQ